jgi:hypothetical protein
MVASLSFHFAKTLTVEKACLSFPKRRASPSGIVNAMKLGIRSVSVGCTSLGNTSYVDVHKQSIRDENLNVRET